MASERIHQVALGLLENALQTFYGLREVAYLENNHHDKVKSELLKVLEIVETIKELGVWQDPQFRQTWATTQGGIGASPDNWERMLLKFAGEYGVSLPPSIKTGREFI